MLHFILACFLAVHASDRIQFPASGLIDLDEGTIEVWLQFAFDPQEVHQRYLWRGSMFYFDYADHLFDRDAITMNLYTRNLARNGDPADMRTYIRFGAVFEGRKVKYPMSPHFPGELKQGSWHHVAVTWSGRDAKVFYDGVLAQHSTHDRAFSRALNGEATLYLDWHPALYSAANLIAMDEIRISSIARRAAALGFHSKLSPDRFTLLLIDFEPGPVKDQIAPAAGATPVSRLPWKLSKAYRFVEGKHGKGIALSPNALKLLTER